MRKREIAFLFGPAVFLLFLYAVFSGSGDAPANRDDLEIRAADIRVIDGDTIEWQGTNYRLLGFDTPETLQADCESERAMGDAASSMLHSLILGADHIKIQVQSGTDKYGRGIARLLVGGEDVGERLISQGLARPYDGGKRQPWCDGE